VVFLGAGAFLFLARTTGAITVRGYCPEHNVEFELPPRAKAPFRVECPVGKEKISRIRAILNYIRHKRKKGEAD